MGAPGSRASGQDLAPFFILKVEGTKLEADITNFVQMVEFESAIDMVDLLKLTIHNPGFVFSFGGPDFTTHKVFQPGNEVDVWAGYGPTSNAVYLGRAIIDKHMPRYPEDGIPVLEIKGYDAAKRMMKQSAEITTAAKPKRDRSKKDAIGKKYPQKLHYEMVVDKAHKYGFAPDVQPTSKVDTLFQKKDMTDFQFVRGLAALNSMEFWVDYDIKLKEWTLHWKPPNTKARPKYVLDYGSDTSAIYSVEAEYGLSEQITDLQVMYFSEKDQQWVRVDTAVQTPGPDMTFRKTAASATATTSRKRSRRGRKPVKVSKREIDLVNEEIKSAESLRLAAGGHSIDVVANRRFKDAADATAFAKRWLQARKDHFIVLKGEMVGIEDMRARDVHEVAGLGKRLSGNYYFTSVRHRLGGGQYRIQFQAHKILE